jgi:predicted metal-dependent phosphoesterase TrpH
MIDLHTHTTASDGTDSPPALVIKAKAAGVTTLAITDHDTTVGWDAAIAAGQEHGVSILRGAEVSASSNGRSVHILSYLHDPKLPGLSELFATTRNSRLSRLERMTELLSADYPITWADVLAQTATGTTVGRPHIADALVASGVVPHRDNAFRDILTPRGKYYVRYNAPSALIVVKTIIESGGVPVLAHPFTTTRGRGLTDDDVEALAAAGLAGIEVWHRELDSETRERAIKLAEKFDLLQTGASDYHGIGKLNKLGEHWTTPDVLEQIAERGALPLIPAH